MADPTDPTDWEKANRGKAQDAYTRAGQATEPLEGKAREPPPEKTAVQSHTMRQTMEPAALRKLDAESHIGRDKANADARLRESLDLMKAVNQRERKEKELEKDGPEK